MKHPRTTCPICRQSIAVRSNDTIRKHNDRDWQPCQGSNKKVLDPGFNLYAHFHLTGG